MGTTTVVWATIDRTHGIALITGKGHDALVTEVAPQSKWSKSGRGWIISLQELSDLCSLCVVTGAVYRERERK